MGEVPTRVLAGVCLATMVSGCSYLATRAGTDPEFFRQLEVSGNLDEAAAQSPIVFIREMTQRGASCFEARSETQTVRSVCGYAVCRNDNSFVNLWEFGAASNRFSALKSRIGGACKQRQPGDLKRIQQEQVRQEILGAGQRVV